jgi:hypothetical protein
MHFELCHTADNGHVTKHYAVFVADTQEEAKAQAKHWIALGCAPDDREGYSLVLTDKKQGWWHTDTPTAT